MRRKYKIKKRHRISALAIISAVIVVLIVMNTGYSLWSSKLNIYGKVTLNYEPPPIDVKVPTTEENKYTTTSGMTNGLGITWFDFVSDEYSGNSLTTTIKVHKNFGTAWFSSNLNVGFSLKNNSQSGIIYTNGKVTQLEVSNPGASVSNVSATILPTTITSGESATFTFAAKVDRSSVKNSTYYKYAITYDVNGVERYFFYTLKILA